MTNLPPGACVQFICFYKGCGHEITSNKHSEICDQEHCTPLDSTLHYSLRICFFCREKSVDPPSHIKRSDPGRVAPISSYTIFSRNKSFLALMQAQREYHREARELEQHRQECRKRIFDREDVRLTREVAQLTIPLTERPLPLERTTNSHFMRAVSEDDPTISFVIKPGKLEKGDTSISLCSLCKKNFFCGQDVRRLPCCVELANGDGGCVFHYKCLLNWFEEEQGLKTTKCPRCGWDFFLVIDDD